MRFQLADSYTRVQTGSVVIEAGQVFETEDAAIVRALRDMPLCVVELPEDNDTGAAAAEDKDGSE